MKTKEKEIVYRNIGDLIPYVNNSRKHSDGQVLQIAASIKEFGFTNPILIDEEGGIIAGHGRIMGSAKLGIDSVPCIVLDGLTEAQKKAYVIADNQLALNADWDFGLLQLEIENLKEMDFDLDLLGFDDDFLGDMFEDVNFEPATEDEQGQLDELDPIMCICPNCGTEFDMRKQE